MKVRTIFFASALALSACVRTEIRQVTTTLTPGAPYHKILVIDVTADETGRGRQMESFMAARLNRDGVEAQSGELFLNDLAVKGSIDQAVARIQDERFDGILVTQHIQGSTDALSEPFSNVRDVFRTYLNSRQMTTAGVASEDSNPLKTVSLGWGHMQSGDGRADLIGTREDRIVWSTEGTVEGSPHKPLEQYMKSFVNAVAEGLRSERILFHHNNLSRA